MSDRRDAGRGRIGPWRLLDLVLATMPFRVGLFGGFGLLPEFGAADARVDRGPKLLPHRVRHSGIRSCKWSRCQVSAAGSQVVRQRENLLPSTLSQPSWRA